MWDLKATARSLDIGTTTEVDAVLFSASALPSALGFSFTVYRGGSDCLYCHSTAGLEGKCCYRKGLAALSSVQ